MIDAINQLNEFGWGSLFMGIVLLICALPTIGQSIDRFINFFGIETKWSLKNKEEAKQIQNIETTVNLYQEELDKDRVKYACIQENLINALKTLQVANKVALADRLNQRYKLYMRLQGIPEDEFDEFVEMHDAYKGVHGNHTIDAKFNKALTLPTLTAEEVADRIKDLGGTLYDNL